MSIEDQRGCLPGLLRQVVGLANESPTDPADDDRHPYEIRGPLLSPAELSFYRVISLAVDDDYVLCPKVRLADLVEVRKEEPNWSRYFNKISAKHIDFVIADAQTLRPLLALELDDKSHQKRKRKVRDAFVDSACEAAGLPLLRVPAQFSYNAQDMRRSIDVAIRG